MKLTLEESQAVVAFNESHLDSKKYPIGEAADLLVRDLMKALPGRFGSATECSEHLLEYLSAGQEMPDGEFFTEAVNTVKAHEANRNSALDKGKRPPSVTTEKLEEVAGNKEKLKQASFREWTSEDWHRLEKGDPVSPAVALTELQSPGPRVARYRDLTPAELAPSKSGLAVNPMVASKPVSPPALPQLQPLVPVPGVAGNHNLKPAESTEATRGQALGKQK